MRRLAGIVGRLRGVRSAPRVARRATRGLPLVLRKKRPGAQGTAVSSRYNCGGVSPGRRPGHASLSPGRPGAGARRPRSRPAPRGSTRRKSPGYARRGVGGVGCRSIRRTTSRWRRWNERVRDGPAPHQRQERRLLHHRVPGLTEPREPHLSRTPAARGVPSPRGRGAPPRRPRTGTRDQSALAPAPPAASGPPWQRSWR